MITGQNKYIERNYSKSFSQPSLIGRRLTVYDVVSQILIENNIDVVLEMYEINILQAKAALEYCSALVCKTDCDDCKFCAHCRLRAIQDNDIFDRSRYEEIDGEEGGKISASKIDQSLIPISLNELESETIGRETWLDARTLLKKYFPDEI